MTVPAVLSPSQLAEAVLKAAEKATPGPWHFDEEYAAVDAGPALWVQPEGDRENEDAAFIALSRTAAPVLARLVLDLRDALKRIAEQQPKTLAMFESNGFVFDSIGREPGNWQHLAFSLYTDICETDGIANAALARLDGLATDEAVG